MPLVFIFLVILGVIALWFLLSFLYEPLGKLFSRIYDDTVKEIKENNKVEKENCKK